MIMNEIELNTLIRHVFFLDLRLDQSHLASRVHIHVEYPLVMLQFLQMVHH